MTTLSLTKNQDSTQTRNKRIDEYHNYNSNVRPKSKIQHKQTTIGFEKDY